MTIRRNIFALTAAALASTALSVGCSERAPVALAAPAPTVKGPVSVYGGLSTHNLMPTRGSTLNALRQHTFLTDGSDSDISVDPTGTWLLYTSTRHSPRPKIYIQRADGVTVTQLTNDDADDANPVFSPDGKTVAFASNRSGYWSIYTMDLEGRNTVQVTNTSGGRAHDIHPSFSPDGLSLTYASQSRPEAWEIWIVDLGTSARRMVGEGLFPTWSPDKSVSRIAFQRPRKQGTWMFSIWTMDLENNEPRRLTEVATSPNAALVTPSWSPDGKRIAFSTISNTPTGTQHDVWVVDGDGQNRRRLTDGVGTALAPTFSPDSRIYFISDRAGAESVWSVNALNTGTDFTLAARNAAAKAVASTAGGAMTGSHGAAPAVVSRRATKLPTPEGHEAVADAHGADAHSTEKPDTKPEAAHGEAPGGQPAHDAPTPAPAVAEARGAKADPNAEPAHPPTGPAHANTETP